MKRAKKSSPGPGKGLIQNAGGDTSAYLGHFRQPKVMREGHNFFFIPALLAAAESAGSAVASGAAAAGSAIGSAASTAAGAIGSAAESAGGAIAGGAKAAIGVGKTLAAKAAAAKTAVEGFEAAHPTITAIGKKVASAAAQSAGKEHAQQMAQKSAANKAGTNPNWEGQA